MPGEPPPGGLPSALYLLWEGGEPCWGQGLAVACCAREQGKGSRGGESCGRLSGTDCLASGKTSLIYTARAISQRVSEFPWAGAVGSAPSSILGALSLPCSVLSPPVSAHPSSWCPKWGVNCWQTPIWGREVRLGEPLPSLCAARTVFWQKGETFSLVSAELKRLGARSRSREAP